MRSHEEPSAVLQGAPQMFPGSRLHLFFLVEGGVTLLCFLGSPVSSSSVTHCDSTKTKISPFL